MNRKGGKRYREGTEENVQVKGGKERKSVRNENSIRKRFGKT